MTDYLERAAHLWEGDPSHLVERVGARQFDEEKIKWYGKQIFQEKWDALRDMRHANILDYGCGVGRLTIPFAKHFGCHVTGFDISRNMVDEANRRAWGISPQTSSLIVAGHYVTPGDGVPDLVPPETVDFIYSVLTFQHICSLNVVRRILNSFHRVLTEGGEFVLQVKKWRKGLRPWNYQPGADGEVGILPDFPELPARYHSEEGNAYTEDELKRVLLRAGLDVEEMKTTDTIDDHGEWLWAYGTKP